MKIVSRKILRSIVNYPRLWSNVYKSSLIEKDTRKVNKTPFKEQEKREEERKTRREWLLRWKLGESGEGQYDRFSISKAFFFFLSFFFFFEWRERKLLSSNSAGPPLLSHSTPRFTASCHLNRLVDSMNISSRVLPPRRLCLPFSIFNAFLPLS